VSGQEDAKGKRWLFKLKEMAGQKVKHDQAGEMSPI
jgi:hypothetical protein